LRKEQLSAATTVLSLAKTEVEDEFELSQEGDKGVRSVKEIVKSTNGIVIYKGKQRRKIADLAYSLKRQTEKTSSLEHR
jgi:hypothetical protein